MNYPVSITQFQQISMHVQSYFIFGTLSYQIILKQN